MLLTFTVVSSCISKDFKSLELVLKSRKNSVEGTNHDLKVHNVVDICVDQ